MFTLSTRVGVFVPLEYRYEPPSARERATMSAAQKKLEAEMEKKHVDMVARQIAVARAAAARVPRPAAAAAREGVPDGGGEGKGIAVLPDIDDEVVEIEEADREAAVAAMGEERRQRNDEAIRKRPRVADPAILRRAQQAERALGRLLQEAESTRKLGTARAAPIKGCRCQVTACGKNCPCSRNRVPCTTLCRGGMCSSHDDCANRLKDRDEDGAYVSPVDALAKLTAGHYR